MFSSEHESKSDEVNETHNAAGDARTTEVANSGAEDSMAENSDMDLDVMEREYNADVDVDPAIDDVGLNDVYGRVGLSGAFQGDVGAVAGTSSAGDLSVGGAALSGSEDAVAESCRQGIQQDQELLPRSGIAEAVIDCRVAGSSTEEVAEVQDGHRGVVAGGGIAPTVAGDGVAYVVDNQIKAVGKVDYTRKVLHGHQIQSGYVCVQVSYVQSQDVSAPLILGDKEENSFLKKGMFFVFPVAKLFRLGKLVAGDKVVLQRYVQ